MPRLRVIDLSKSARTASAYEERALLVPPPLSPMEHAEFFAKRVVDVVLALTGLLLTAPIWPVLALMIRLQDGGPVFFFQERWGRYGSSFKIMKFRTMVPDADQRFGISPALDADHRVTRPGRWLRRMGLDELPQLLNILIGDMSFVGPRALAKGEMLDGDNGGLRYEDLPGFAERLTLRPGLTGISTVFRPKDISPQLKFRYDLFYIRNRSLVLDIQLIARSIWISLSGGWERRDSKF